MQPIATPAAQAPALREHSTLTVENIPITLIDRGSGTPTLLLHGIFDSADTWGGVVERLRGHFRVLAPDLPGFGRSGAPADYDASLPHLAQFIDNLLAAAGINEPINLVGYDIGATYGLAWAVSHPAKVRRLAIMNGNFVSDYEWHPWAKVWRIRVLGELILGLVNESTYARSMAQSAPGITLEQALAAAKMVTPAAKRMALRHYRALDSANFRGWEDRLRELTARVPTLVAWGDRDPFIAPRYAERYGAREVHHFAEYGHWLPLEAPDALADRLISFFNAEDD
ncbi:MAG TPA: alpha/beta hydrolase [Roseiflexaceae bacterium]|nr:alpha/beta hydrolase [Roseiflexaceae bacterium]